MTLTLALLMALGGFLGHLVALEKGRRETAARLGFWGLALALVSAAPVSSALPLLGALVLLLLSPHRTAP